MANRIVELRRERIERKQWRVHILMLYPLNPPISVNGNTVILRDRTTLPPGVEDWGVLSAPELNAIDSGDGTFREDFIEIRPGQTFQDVLELARKAYQRGARLIQNERIAYENFGERHDES